MLQEAPATYQSVPSKSKTIPPRRGALDLSASCGFRGANCRGRLRYSCAIANGNLTNGLYLEVVITVRCIAE
jgi:hypothetical protein